MTAEPTADTGSNARLTLWLCFAVAVLEGYDLQVVSIAGPLLREAMQLSPRQMGVAFSASLMGLAFGAALGGTIADFVGRKKVLIFSVVGLGIFTLATAFADDFRTLMILRMLTGVAIGGAMPNLIAISAAVAGRGRSIGKVTAMICGMPAGGILSALGGHALASRFGWQSLFVLGGLLTVIIVPILIRRLPDSKPIGQEAQPRVVWHQSLFGAGRAPVTLLLWALFILTLAILSALTGWAPTLIIDKGLPAAAGFTVLMALNAGGILGALIMAPLCDRWNVRTVMLCTYAGMALSLWLFGNASSASSVIPLAGLAGFFVLGAQFTLYGVSPQLYPAANHGAGVGSAVAAGRIGSIVGPIVAGYIISRGASADDVINSMVPVAVAAGIALLGLAAVSGPALTSNAAGRRGA